MKQQLQKEFFFQKQYYPNCGRGRRTTRVENPRLSLGVSYDKTLKSLTLGIFTKSGIFDGFKPFLLTCQIAWSVNQLWLDLIIVLCKHVTNKSQVCRNGRVSVQGVKSLWGHCRFIPADWGSQQQICAILLFSKTFHYKND